MREFTNSDVRFIYKEAKAENGPSWKFILGNLNLGIEQFMERMSRGNGKIKIDADSTLGYIIDDVNRVIEVYGQGFSGVAGKYLFVGLYNVEYIGINGPVRCNDCAIEMFFGCKKLKAVNMVGLITDKVKSMKGMFKNCVSLESVNMNYIDTGRVNTMYQMFYNCISLTSMDLSGCNLSKLKSTTEMFNNCMNVEEVKLGRDLESVEHVSGMFYKCYNINSVDFRVSDEVRGKILNPTPYAK